MNKTKENPVVLITGLNNDFDKKLAGVFLREGYKVLTLTNNPPNGITPLPLDINAAAAEIKKSYGYIDFYIDVTNEFDPSDNFDVRSGLNDNVIRKLYDVNVVQPMFMLEVFKPLLDAGEGKRLCYLTSAEASINEAQGTDGYGYKMAKAGLHNFLQITRNVLAPGGFTIRVFDPMQKNVLPESAAEAAFNYFTRGRGIERGDPHRDDESNLVFRDAFGRQHSW
jgi:NAD(P)-dependent dehydrogenase (short-subunit alcohol dehydrogenase family)